MSDATCECPDCATGRPVRRMRIEADRHHWTEGRAYGKDVAHLIEIGIASPETAWFMAAVSARIARRRASEVTA